MSEPRDRAWDVHVAHDGTVTLTVGHAKLNWPDLDTFLAWQAAVQRKVAARKAGQR